MKGLRGACEADSLSGRLANGVVWSLIGAVILQGSNLISSILTARLLGREQFGEYGMVQSTVGMLGIFAGLGLGVTATKYVAELRRSDPERAGRIIGLSLLVALISGGLLAVALTLFAETLAAVTLNAPSLVLELRIASIVLFLTAFNGAQTGSLSGLEAFRTIAKISLARGVLTFPVTVILVLFWRLPGAIWALVVSAALACLLSHFYLRSHCAAEGISLRFSGALRERRVLWAFSTPAFFSSALVSPAMWLANIMLVHQAGGYAELALLSAANQWRSAIGFIPGVLGQTALPILSSLHGNRDRARYANTLQWNLALTAITAGAAALPVIVGAPWIMRAYGPGFAQGWPVLTISATTAFVSCLNGAVGTAILSSGAAWAGFAFNAMWAGVFISGCHFLVVSHGAFGQATAMLAAYLAHTIWQVVYLRRCLFRLYKGPCPETLV